MTKPAHGLWIDDAPREVAKPDYWAKLKDHGISVAAVMLESVSAGFDPRYTLAELGVLGNLARRADIELVLTVWPEPRPHYLAQLVEKIPPILRASGATALEFDAESNFTRKRVAGFKNLEEAAEATAQVLIKFRDLAIRSELTTFTMHSENSKSAQLADDVDRLLPQAYSVRNRKDAKGDPLTIEWGGAYGPGAMQRLTLNRALEVPRKENGKPELSCGLAAYDQEWPGHTGEDAMRVAYEAALTYSPKEIRWWSSKWVVGGVAKAYASRFLRSIA